jgi:uncharacterized membrane protein YagU involved in acid resistance
MPAQLRSAGNVIATAGLIAGTIDIGAACLINSLSPVIILKAIAGGVLGAASLRMGPAAALLGLILQWAMSCLIAAIYVFAARRIALLQRSWVLSGLAYGIAVFLVMNYAVMPLSAVGHSPSFSPPGFVANLLAMFLFALIITYTERRPSPQSRAVAAA